MEFGDSIDKLKNFGFLEKKDTLQTDELRMLISNNFEKDVAIQVVVNGSAFEKFIFFRDLMNWKNPE